MRIAILMCCLMAFQWAVEGQVVGDAVRFSTYRLTGTARSVGVGGSLGALGADFSVASGNPAGLAQYRKSEFIFSPAFLISSTDAEMKEIGEMNGENMLRFNFSSLGVVFANRPRNNYKWSTFNVALGFNRLANFNRRFSSSANTTGSITDQWVIDVNEGIINNFYSELGVEAGAVYPNDNNSEFFTDFDLNPTGVFEHEQEFKSTGSLNEMVFSFAGNFKERLMIGMTLGIPFVSYNEERVYKEDDTSGDVIPAFERLRFEERLNTSGIGINLKLGAIYRISQAVRIGGAIHTPSRLVLTDNFQTEFDYTYSENGGIFTGDVESQESNFDYDFRTPWRFIGNLGFLIKRSGFISAEVEWLNYGSGRFNLDKDGATQADRDYQVVLNDQIGRDLGSAINFRLGGEFAYKILRFRAGYNLMGSAFDGDDPTSAISLGVGSRFRNIFIDLAYNRSQIEESFAPYSLNGNFPIVVGTDEINHRIIITAGFKF
ncbi:MAG: hypothetical protein AAFV95_05330 [Bacteroidota bacterium]